MASSRARRAALTGQTIINFTTSGSSAGVIIFGGELIEGFDGLGRIHH
jgi:hypothetical protein